MSEEELEEYLARALHRADYGDTEYFPSARFTRMAKSLVPAVKDLLGRGTVNGKVTRVETREYRWCWTADPLKTLKFLTDECFDYSASILWRGGKWLILTDGHDTIAEDFEGYVLTDGSGAWWFETPDEFNRKHGEFK